MIGKLTPEELETFLTATGVSDPLVQCAGAYGEDAAAITIGDTTLVISTDPVSLAGQRVGTIGINVACNDVAACGADPRWLTSTIFLPDQSEALRRSLADQLDTAAKQLGVTIVGGHSEYMPLLDRPLLVLSAFGTTDRFISTGGASPGDVLVLTKGAAIEATAILSSDFADDLREGGVDESTIETALTYFEDISVMDDARLLRSDASAMHDPTEGGIVAALVEMANASTVELTVDETAIPIDPVTSACCTTMDIDPLRTFASGSLLASVPSSALDSVRGRFEQADISLAVIGEVSQGTGVVIGGDRIDSPPRDSMYRLWE